jgi:hypothetical protein
LRKNGPRRAGVPVLNHAGKFQGDKSVLKKVKKEIHFSIFLIEFFGWDEPSNWARFKHAHLCRQAPIRDATIKRSTSFRKFLAQLIPCDGVF